MKGLLSIIVFFVVLNNCFAQAVQLLNGNFYQNGSYKKRPVVYIEKGNFTFNKPKTIDTTIDLDNQFILPPFAEGHSHKLDNQNELKQDVKTFLAQGVFYVLVLNNFSTNVENNRKILDETNSLDVLFANGGITATGQHPSFAYERIVSGIKEWWLPDNTAKIKSSRKAENDAYWFMDTVTDVEAKWDAFLRTKPDIVKVYLMDVAGNNRQEYKALSEHTIKEIVKKAKAANLRVVAHIETLDDLKVGLRCGIHIYGHMPYYNSNYLKELPANYQFTKSEKKLIKKLKPIIIPTLSFNDEFSIVRNERNNYQGELETSIFKRTLDFQKRSVKQLKSFGFQFAIGSDRDFLMPELMYWFKNNIFSYSEILTITTKVTPSLIFPHRKLGEFKEGYEGSFLVFKNDPLENYNELKHIQLKVKRGRIIK